MYLSKYGVARHIYLPIIKRAVVDFAVGADWTPAAGDVKISKDGGAAANVTNLPTAIVMGNTAMWDFSLTATEMQAAQVMVFVADAATKAVEDQSFVIETYGHASAQHEHDLDSPTVTLADAGITAAKFAAAAIDAAAIASDAFGSAELAGSAASEIAAAVLAATSAELTSVPAASATLQQKIDWLFELARNKLTQTTSQTKVYRDDGATVLGTAPVTDTTGTLTRGEFV